MQTLEQYGFFRAAVATPQLRVADVDFNVRAMVEVMERVGETGARLIVFPELALTGYSCGDLFFERKLLDAAKEGLVRLAEATEYEPMAVVVGVPLEVEGRLYNCAAFLCAGNILGIVPKTHLPSTREFYERRWFTTQPKATAVTIGSQQVPLGTDLLFRFARVPECVVGIEICEDLWSVQPPSGALALAGATVIANPSASTEAVGKADYRKSLVAQQSARCHCAYLYAASGVGESSTDVVYSGHGLIGENGRVLAELNRFAWESTWQVCDLDVQAMLGERLHNASFQDSPAGACRMITFNIPDSERPTRQPREVLRRAVEAEPFVPSEEGTRQGRCAEVFAIQSAGLGRRLKHARLERVVIGISGGLDSTLALMATVKAFESLGLPLAGIVAVTMPGFGTSSRTRDNATRLAQLLGVTLKTVSISEAVSRHFADIAHDPACHNVVYENAQARERTQVLMDIANQCGGLVVGTGDLSEAALGWCTFNGDHMSMYHVNTGVPKTLVRHLVSWCAETLFGGEISAVLRDIAATPVSPELLPLSAQGELVQETEKVVGPYVLHDFFLYYTVRYGFVPGKVLVLAKHAFGERFPAQEILQWMEVFYRRFFSQQFKRSSMPDGPKVGAVALSPRGDWRMPSDAEPTLWLNEIARLKKTC